MVRLLVKQRGVTRRQERYNDRYDKSPRRTLFNRCQYCDHNKYPEGKIIDPTTDMYAKQTARGDWMRGVCVNEEVKKLLEMNRIPWMLRLIVELQVLGVYTTTKIM
jgi:hypothetical protein